MRERRLAGEAVLFLLMVRYCADVEAELDASLNEILASRFGHLATIRGLLGLAEEK